LLGDCPAYNPNGYMQDCPAYNISNTVRQQTLNSANNDSIPAVI